ncbi:MAG: hypothetical protein J5642_07775, partial [Bacteroidales bacterium]|nr:hypothetical protein [Bacteroidales bacterium]
AAAPPSHPQLMIIMSPHHSASWRCIVDSAAHSVCGGLAWLHSVSPACLPLTPFAFSLSFAIDECL